MIPARGTAEWDGSRPRVVYILGAPYSGSTLFALALGAFPEVVNLGEVSFLENDYRAATRCLCGELLPECVFWGPVKTELDRRQAGVDDRSRFRLAEDGRLAAPDRREKPAGERIMLGLGLPPERIYPEPILSAYRCKHSALFGVAAGIAGNRILVDASKSPLRLELLLGIPEIDIRVIRLVRDPAGVLASRLKRGRRSRRDVYPFSTLANIVWLSGLTASIDRIYRRLPEHRRSTVRFEEFVDKPGEVLESLSALLGIDCRLPPGSSRRIGLTGQHIYVGNRWVFESPGDEAVEIAPPAAGDPLSRADRAVFRLAARMIPRLKH